MDHGDIVRIEKDELVLQGWLLKQGIIHTNWRKRWFRNTLSSLNTLEYYSESTCAKTSFKGTIDLKKVVEWRVNHGKSLGDNMVTGILLRTSSRTWKLVAEGATNSDYWTRGFNHLLRRVHPPKTVPTTTVSPATTTTSAHEPHPTKNHSKKSTHSAHSHKHRSSSHSSDAEYRHHYNKVTAEENRKAVVSSTAEAADVDCGFAVSNLEEILVLPPGTSQASSAFNQANLLPDVDWGGF
ncbi:hypothetical protein Pelo_9704 [Pelomyxa schiedti]|nr:hypothetical protein Pelo_9704 [Pelomyxa schiedti]